MNFGEMKKYTRMLMGDDPVAPHYGNETMALFLNACVLTIASEMQPIRTYFEFDTIAFDDVTLALDDNRREGRYPMPESIVSVKAMEILIGTEYRQLSWKAFDEYQAAYGLTAQSGQPESWREEWGAVDQTSSPPGDFWLGPKPNGVFTVRASIFRLPLPIGPTADDKTYEIPRAFHPCVCFKAGSELCLTYDDTSRAQQLERKYEKAFARACIVVGMRNRTGDLNTSPVVARSKMIQRRKRY